MEAHSGFLPHSWEAGSSSFPTTDIFSLLHTESWGQGVERQKLLSETGVISVSLKMPARFLGDSGMMFLAQNWSLKRWREKLLVRVRD